MSNQAKDLMTADPQCCTEDTPLNEVAKLMVKCDCGEVPVVGQDKKLIGVVTDRDIVCRIVAEGKNPSAFAARDAMTRPAISVTEYMSQEDVMARMEEHQIRRVPVVDAAGVCCGIIAQADVALGVAKAEVGELVREVSRGPVTH